jgi:hypothetical protein
VNVTVADISALISVAALGTAVYGIFERGSTAKRAERKISDTARRPSRNARVSTANGFCGVEDLGQR